MRVDYRILEAAATACMDMCRSGRCPLRRWTASVIKPVGCPVPDGTCADVSLSAWMETIRAAASADVGLSKIPTPSDKAQDESDPMLLTIKQTATLLGISASSILRLVQRRVLPQPIRLGSLVRWRRTEIEAFVRGDGCTSSPQEPEAPPRRGRGRPKGSRNKPKAPAPEQAA